MSNLKKKNRTPLFRGLRFFYIPFLLLSSRTLLRFSRFLRSESTPQNTPNFRFAPLNRRFSLFCQKIFLTYVTNKLKNKK